MLTLTKVFRADLDDSVIERLYNEALPFISEERKRAGEEELRNILVNGFGDRPIIKYEVDNYIVAVACYTKIIFNKKPYMMHHYPIYGNDVNGSRAWWYSEEFQQKNSEFVRNQGFAGLITFYNPLSPAAIAVKNHIGSFDDYYKLPVDYDIGDINPGLKGSDGKLRAYVIDLVTQGILNYDD